MHIEWIKHLNEQNLTNKKILKYLMKNSWDKHNSYVEHTEKYSFINKKNIKNIKRHTLTYMCIYNKHTKTMFNIIINNAS